MEVCFYKGHRRFPREEPAQNVRPQHHFLGSTHRFTAHKRNRVRSSFELTKEHGSAELIHRITQMRTASHKAVKTPS